MRYFACPAKVVVNVCSSFPNRSLELVGARRC
jgi:hypothetical protein